ncbi:hypothetical protein GT037_007885 [Alternaria burnsii]|uniref:Uncharacterized protein n=1 Tax=Alternaria burnsii TaxID=1187904 RepID=A0A8H7B3W8_9PLEO|nr:uncharacterized protein GT037_007885 [Alternaria burnsii]KAF7674119.1 hypothetical protein GT037_007885 [Alternaria burnsii]
MRIAVLATLLPAVHGVSTQYCHTTVKSNSRLGIEDPITPIWTPGSRYGSGLPGPMPSSSTAAFTGLLSASLESAWQWPILSSSFVTTVNSVTSKPIASVSPSVPTQSSVFTLDCEGKASLRPTLTITSTCSSIAFDPPSTAASTIPSLTSPSSIFMSQYPPAYPSLPILPHDPTSLTWSSVHSCTSSAFPSPTFTSKEPINISYDSLFGLPSHPSSQTRGGTVPSIFGPSTKSIPKKPTSTMNFLTLKTSLTFCEALTHKTDPAVITSIMVPDRHCPYPYPRIYCGETMTILVTKTKDKPKTSDSGCPYPGHDISC